MKEIFNFALSENKDTELLAFTGWVIWNRRNQVCFNEAACPLDQILNLSKERKVEFQGTRSPTQKLGHRNHVRWRPPTIDEVKINYNGTIFSEEGRAGLGVVCRNSDGGVIASLSEQISLPTPLLRSKHWQRGEQLCLQWNLASLLRCWRVILTLCIRIYLA